MEQNNFTNEKYIHAKELMPAGTQLLSKRPEMLAPDLWPAYFSEAKGCETWDLDGKHYYDMSTNGIGACLLGFRDEDVTRAVIQRIEKGSMCSLNPPEEVDLADRLCDIHPWADQARFARTGGEACAVAVRIARATTNRDIVVICGYHGWHDWYLACNLGEDDSLMGHLLPGLEPKGVPRQLRETSFTFRFNKLEELEELVKKHGSKIAAVIMEPTRNNEPEPGFLEGVKSLAHGCGARLIFDEITIGFRLCFGGAHLKYSVEPDIAIFAKSLGNGHPIAAIIGTREAMKGANDSFISSTYWTEGVGPVAALATLDKMESSAVHEYVDRVGERVIKSWALSAEKHGLPVTAGGCYPCLAHFAINHEKKEALRTLYTQMMLERGFLAGLNFYPSLAHDVITVSLYEKAIDEVFGEMARIVEEDRILESLKGPVAHSGFKRLL